jgi:hypothetical protein
MTVLFIGKEEVSKDEMKEIETYCKRFNIPPSTYFTITFIEWWKDSRNSYNYFWW